MDRYQAVGGNRASYTLENCTSRKPPKPRTLPEKMEVDVASPDTEELTPPCPGDHDGYSVSCKCTEGCTCPGCTEQLKEVLKLTHENQLLTEQLEEALSQMKIQSQDRAGKCETRVSRFIRNDRSTRIHTGLPLKQAFCDLLSYAHPYVQGMRYWKGVKTASKTSTKVPRHFRKTPRKFGPQRKLSEKNELLLTLMKLRQGLSFQVLADIFAVSVSTCSTVFNTWIKVLAMLLRPLIFWPEKDINQEMIPEQLRAQFPRLRCTIDCTEVYIGRPRHLELQAQTWSDYKHHNTIKFLVGIAPNGHISFVSRAYGGRASDRQITRESGFLDLVEPYDMIMADRGFPIQEDLLLRRASLYIPPPSSGLEQQGRADVQKTKLIANGRIHVERAIGRVKWFNILSSTLPINMVPLVDDIITVCAGLCNLLPPLVV